MKKILTISVVLIFCSPLVFSQKLTSKTRVSVLTVQPGHEELYAAFGHSAIRVQDVASGVDKVYNYGTYYYNQPHFYLNFARGYLLYGLSVTNYKRFKAYYAYFNRQITAQYLNLTLEEKQSVYDYLENNSLPENSKYYYDYFYDNCATRIRDVFSDVFDTTLIIPKKFAPVSQATIRQLTDYYIKDAFPWGKLGIDLCLGLPMDKQLSNFEYMYLPDFLFLGMANTKISYKNKKVPFVAKTEVILANRPMEYPMVWFTPSLAFSLLLALGLLIFVVQLKKGTSFKWFDVILFILLGTLGLFLFLLWFATDHHAAAKNFNLLWAIPFHLPVAFALARKQVPRWANWYFALVIPFSIMLLVFWKFLPQDLNEGFIPIVLLVIVRSIAILKR